MTKRIVTLDCLTLRLPRHALAHQDAIVQEVKRALGDTGTASAETVTVTAAPSLHGEGGQALAQRIGRATAARLRQGGGS